MRQVKVWRYYCDFCKKAGCGKAALARHEAHCVHNPNRACRMCELSDGGSPEAPAELAKVIEETGSMDALREAARGCPACMLAGASAFNGDKNQWDDEEGAPFWVDFAAERERFWAEMGTRFDRDAAGIY